MRKLIHNEIETERLVLRRIEESDSDVILFLRTDKSVNKYIERPEERKIRNITDAITLIKRINTETLNDKSISWGITINTVSKVIGTICLWNFSQDFKTAEIGYDLDPEFHKMGIMTEALKSVINFGFSKLSLNKIEAFTHFKNENSRKLLDKNGFQLNKNRKDDNINNVIFELQNSIINTKPQV